MRIRFHHRISYFYSNLDSLMIYLSPQKQVRSFLEWVDPRTVKVKIDFCKLLGHDDQNRRDSRLDFWRSWNDLHQESSSLIASPSEIPTTMRTSHCGWRPGRPTRTRATKKRLSAFCWGEWLCKETNDNIVPPWDRPLFNTRDCAWPNNVWVLAQNK